MNLACACFSRPTVAYLWRAHPWHLRGFCPQLGYLYVPTERGFAWLVDGGTHGGIRHLVHSGHQQKHRIRRHPVALGCVLFLGRLCLLGGRRAAIDGQHDEQNQSVGELYYSLLTFDDGSTPQMSVKKKQRMERKELSAWRRGLCVGAISRV